MFVTETYWFEYDELSEEAKNVAHSNYVSSSYGEEFGDCSFTLINMVGEIPVIISDAGLIETAPISFEDYGYPGSKVWIEGDPINHFDVWDMVDEVDNDVFELCTYDSLMKKLEYRYDLYFNEGITYWNQKCDDYYALLATYSGKTFSYNEVLSVVEKIESLIDDSIASLEDGFCSALERCSEDMCSREYFESEVAPNRVFSADGNDYEWK